MLIGILGISNPGHQQYRMFDHVEGRQTHDYFIFSIYQQYADFTISTDGKYRICRRFMGIAGSFYEISPVKIKLE